MSVCRHFRALGQSAGNDALIGSVVFLILAPYDNEQADLTHRVYEDKELDKLPEYKYVLVFLSIVILFKYDATWAAAAVRPSINECTVISV